jgi:hypothetical protein
MNYIPFLIEKFDAYDMTIEFSNLMSMKDGIACNINNERERAIQVAMTQET